MLNTTKNWKLSRFLIWAQKASNASHGKWSPVPIKAASITPRICVSTATTVVGAQRKHGPANTVRSCTTQRASARTVIYQGTTAHARSKRSAKSKKPQNCETTWWMRSKKTKLKPKPPPLPVMWFLNPNRESPYSPTLFWAKENTQRLIVIIFERNLYPKTFYRSRWG